MVDKLESLRLLGTQGLTVKQVTTQAKLLGCNTVVLPKQIATRDVRSDGSRIFLEVDSKGIVTNVSIH